jgi:hypothetical protein
MILLRSNNENSLECIDVIMEDTEDIEKYSSCSNSNIENDDDETTSAYIDEVGKEVPLGGFDSAHEKESNSLQIVSRGSR